MINKDFIIDWKNGGEVNIIDTSHFSLSIDKDYISLCLAFSLTYNLIYIALWRFVFRFY